MDNVDTQTQDNADTQTQDATASTDAATDTQATATTGWKNGLTTDIKNSPFMAKFDDTPEGLNKFTESYGNLEKLLGHEKVPIPKDANDVEGWNRFSKAMGIPDKAEGYGLPDATLPDSMKGMTIDKNRFAEIMHAHKVPPAAVKSMWKIYNEVNVDAYNKHLEGLQKGLATTINTLKSEWGDAYQTNVELGQLVINQFSPDQETNDFITASLMKDPRGIKWLAKIGDQFAENKVPEFNMKRFTLAPDQAKEEIDKIKRDPKHPYNDQSATDAEHKRAVDYVNGLYALIQRGKG